MSADDLAARLAHVRARVAGALARAGRPADGAHLVAVSKTQPTDALRVAAAAGQLVFGENYVQELRTKQESLGDLELEWHFIGRLQKNKAKDVVGRAALVHGVDGLELAQVLDRRAAAAGVTQKILVEVNLGGESTKGGVTPEELPSLLDGLAPLGAVRCEGLMTMPPPATTPEDSRPYFRALADLARRHGLPELSMGMSDDFEVAIEEGATLVRVGTAIFGPRRPRSTQGT